MCDLTSCRLLQVVGGLDIHKKMVVDVWQLWFFSPPFTEDQLEDVVQRNALFCFQRKWKIPPPPPPPRAFWSQTFSRSYWTQTLSDSTSHSRSWQAAFYRKSQFLLEESWSVCVLYVLLVFQGVWVFYIYFAVSFYFLESEEVYLKEMSVDDCSWRWCYLISEQHKQLEVPTRVYRVKSVFTLEMWLYYWMHLSYWSFA